MLRMTNTARRAAIYARLSVSSEESVSIERQVESARQYAAARGWTVVLEATDDGVSATKSKPEDRPGWREILDAPERFDVVLCWKVDRLARRTSDFLAANEALEARGAGVACVEQSIDMTSPDGRLFATILAAFAEAEAAAISSRVKAARSTLTRSGRIAAGDLAWPLTKVPNPDGPGYVARPIEARAEAVRDAAAWLLDGVSLSEVARRWTAAGLPTSGKGRRDRSAPLASWSRISVRQVMTNPVLWGATVHRGEILRAADRSPVVDASRVILDRGTFERVAEVLARNPRRSGSTGAALPLLHGLAVCAACGSTLNAHRPADPKRPSTYRCQSRECSSPTSVGLDLLDAYVSDRVLSGVGRVAVTRVEVTEVAADPSAVAALRAEIAEAEADSLDRSLSREERLSAMDRADALTADLDRLLDLPAETVETVTSTGETFAEAWSRADLEERREILGRALLAVEVRKATARGKAARVLDDRRVSLAWTS